MCFAHLAPCRCLCLSLGRLVVRMLLKSFYVRTSSTCVISSDARVGATTDYVSHANDDKFLAYGGPLAAVTVVDAGIHTIPLWVAYEAVVTKPHRGSPSLPLLQTSPIRSLHGDPDMERPVDVCGLDCAKFASGAYRKFWFAALVASHADVQLIRLSDHDTSTIGYAALFLFTSVTIGQISCWRSVVASLSSCVRTTAYGTNRLTAVATPS